VFAVVFAGQKICSYDVWWHLKTGEWMWKHHAIPWTDPFSYTFAGAEWIDFEWLFQALIYPVYRLGGFEGLIVFKIVVVVALFFILYQACRREDGGRRLNTVTVLFLALLIARIRFLVRPQIVFLCFLALYVYLFALYRDKKISVKTLVLLLFPLQVLWANFHSSFVMGLVLAGLQAVGAVIPLIVAHRRDLKPLLRDTTVRNFALVCVALVVASLCTPYTFRVFIIHFKTVGAVEILQGVAEWVPVDIRLLGVLTVDHSVWFRALFLLGAVTFLVQRENLRRLGDVLVFAFFSYMAFKHLRFAGAFAVVAAPIVVGNLRCFRSPQGLGRWLKYAPLVILMAFAARDVRALMTVERLGLGVWRHYPEATVDFLKDHGIKGRMFNTYGIGGYMIW
jgi:hypothetical protein